jgi:hypothetical protein
VDRRSWSLGGFLSRPCVLQAVQTGKATHVPAAQLNNFTNKFNVLFRKRGIATGLDFTFLFYIVQNQKQKCTIQALVIALR